jgi:PPOX class probable F420-dependent enzyme
VDREEAVARLRGARLGSLATVRPDGRPHVVPFVFALVGEGADLRAYWAVDHKPKRSTSLQRLRNLESNPSVEFEVNGYDEDWSRLWWVRAGGRGRIVENVPERAAALAALAAKYPGYEERPPEGAVVAIDVERVTGWHA